MIIYKVTNTINGKIYVGKTTKSLDERKKSHLKSIRLNVKTKFYNAIRKYGVVFFIWEELVECYNIDELNNLEIYYIEKFNSFKCGYNMTHGGDTISMKSIEDKKNQGAKIGSVPWNKGINMKKLGYTFNNRKTRHPFTEEEKIVHKTRIKESKKYQEGLKHRTHGMSRKVIRVEDNITWNTIKECSEEIGVNKSTVCRYIHQSKPINDKLYKFLEQ
jgi:group I intron endonuclease